MQPDAAARSKVFTPAVLWTMAIVDALIGLAMTGLAGSLFFDEARILGRWPDLDPITLIPLLVGLSLLASAGSLPIRRPSVILGSIVAHLFSSLLFLAVSAMLLLVASQLYVGANWMFIVPPLALLLTLIQLRVLFQMRREAAALAEANAALKDPSEDLAVKPGWDEANHR